MRTAAHISQLQLERWSVDRPLLAAQVLIHHSYRAAYLLLAVVAAVAALACWFLIQDAPEAARPAAQARSFSNLRLIIVFALAAFLQVGVENTAAAWLSTYALRMAATVSCWRQLRRQSIGWDFLSSRGFLVAVVVARKSGTCLSRGRGGRLVCRSASRRRSLCRRAQRRYVLAGRCARTYLSACDCGVFCLRSPHLRLALGAGYSRIRRIGIAMARRLDIHPHRKSARRNSHHSGRIAGDGLCVASHGRGAFYGCCGVI